MALPGMERGVMVTLSPGIRAMADAFPPTNTKAQAVVDFLKRAAVPAIPPLTGGGEDQETSSERRLDNTAK